MLSPDFQFDGDFDLLPFAAEMAYGIVPQYPTDSDFHEAVSLVAHERTAASVWFLEAVRARRKQPWQPLDKTGINGRVAARLYRELEALR